MKLRPISVLLLANVATFSAARAQARLIEINPHWIWIQHADGRVVGYNTLFVFLLAVCVLFLISVAIGLLTTSSRSSSVTYTNNVLSAAQWHEQETARLQALKRQMDAETALTASLIEKARTDAEYSELDQITDHAREVGRLKREL
jgi:hypothetical protein